MQPLYRNRRRFSNGLRPRRTAVIALAVMVLMSLQIATTTVARLLWPAHTHVAVHTEHRAANVGSSCRLPVACADKDGVFVTADRLPSSLEIRSTARAGKRGRTTALAQVAMFPHPDHLRQWLEHADAHLPVPASGHASPPGAGSGGDETAWPQHSHIEGLTHALAHAAGVGHHRHALGTAGVVYIDDDIPQLPAKLLMRSSDISLLLLPPAHLLLPVREGSGAAPPGPPSLPLLAQYSLPGDRPPR